MNLECALSWLCSRLRQWDGCGFAVSEGARTKVDKVCSGLEGGRPTIATGLGVRQTGVDEVLWEAQSVSCLL